MKFNQVLNRQAGSIPAAVLFALALLSLASLFAAPALRADDTGQPARAIRLSYVDGKVQLLQGDQPVAEQAVINTPLLQGMTLVTADDGKAEIQFEDGSVARLAPNSSLTLTTLTGAGSSAEADLTLDRGEAYFELQGNGQVGAMRVHFADSVVTGSGFTVLRIQNDTPPGALAVFSGNAHIDRSSGQSIDLHGGESVAFTQNDANGYDVAETIASDSWDAFNADRDQALNAEAASQTSASSDLAPGQTANPAWSDLDASGTWYNVPNQGYVWSPYDASNAGFDPYGNGNWVWMPGFGYTWASGYSWGYLPYSCGAWNFYNGFGWGWAPGFGGCSPWWNTGFYGGPVIGFAPGGYRPVHRPEPPREGPRRGHPIPMVAVVNHQRFGEGHLLPARDRNTPVNIGGATVVGLRPFPGNNSPRPTSIVRGFNSPPRSGFTVQPQGSLTGQSQGNFNGQSQSNSNRRPVYITPRSAYTPPAQSANPAQLGNPGVVQPQRPGGFTPQPGRTYTPPVNHNNAAPARSAPAPAPHVYTPPPSPPPSRPSGGGGGGYHPSPSAAPSGGGGGGGGSHSGGNSGHH